MTIEEMEETLHSLGVEIIDSRGDEINCYCVAHEQRTGHVDHNPSFWINADSTAFICFSCGWAGNVYTLVKYITGGTYTPDFDTEPSAMLKRFRRITQEKVQEIAEPTRVNESMLSAFTMPPLEAMANRGLTPLACNDYEVLWDRHNANWITVLRNPVSGRLMGWQEKGAYQRHFKNVPTGIKKSTTLFGFNKYQGGDMIVVESPLDVVRLASIGIKGGVATFGTSVSIEQVNLIRSADRIIFAMDNDDAGRSASKSLLHTMREMGVECWFFYYGDIDAKDIGGMSKAEVLEGLEKAKHLVQGEKAIV